MHLHEDGAKETTTPSDASAKLSGRFFILQRFLGYRVVEMGDMFTKIIQFGVFVRDRHGTCGIGNDLFKEFDILIAQWFAVVYSILEGKQSHLLLKKPG